MCQPRNSLPTSYSRLRRGTWFGLSVLSLGWASHVHMHFACFICVTYHFQHFCIIDCICVICFRGCTLLIYIDHSDMLDVSLWSCLWAWCIAMLLLALDMYACEMAIFSMKMLNLSSLVSWIPYMFILCSNMLYLAKFVHGYHALFI
jgi:hypothetical protein